MDKKEKLIQIMSPFIDEQIAKIKKANFKIDPIATKLYSFIPSFMSSAYKRHGGILEKSILNAINLNSNYSAWSEDNYRVSYTSQNMTSNINNIKQDPDWLDFINIDLDYEKEGKKTSQIDVIAYNHENRKLIMLEVKRGTSHHDAGKKKNILKTFLEISMHLKNYGIVSEGLKVDTSEAKILNYYGAKEFHERIHLDKDSLDEFLGIEVVEDIEAVNHQYRKRIIETIDEMSELFE